VADLQVSIALLLENQDEIRRALEAEGGKAGDAFRNRLTPAAKKAFDEISSAAEKAAKDVGVRFNSTKLQFETAKGEIIPSSVLDKISQGGSKIAAAFKEARNGVDVFKSAVVSGAGEAASSLNILEAAVTGVAQSLTSRLTDAAMSGIGALKNMVGGFMELDTELRSAAAAAGEEGGYERLGAVVERVGIDAAGTSKQVAELATSLVKAGFSVGEVETALPGVVRGAEATGTAFERFGEIAGSTLRQFGLEASEIGRVGDVITQTVNGTNATVEGFAYAMNEAAPVAKALGISLEDTAAAVGILANAGLQGSVAGTGLKTMMLKMQQAAGGATPEVLGLAQGQERLAKIMKMMGGDVLDATGKLKPLDQVFLKIKSTMDTLSQGDRAALATALFGEDGGPKFLAIINQGTTAIEGVFGKVRDSAGAVDEARDATNGFQRQLTTLTGTMDSLAIGVGKVAADGLTPLLSVANTVIGALAGLPEPIKEGAGALVIMGTAAVTAGVGLAGLNAAVGMLGGWTALAGSIGTVVALLSGPIAATVGTVLALGAAAGVVASQFGGVDSGMKSLIQSAGALGAFLITLRLIRIAQDAWTASTKGTAGWMTFLTALQGPKGIGQIAVAAGVAGVAFAGLGAVIKETGQETAALEQKSKGLKDEVASLDKQIAEGKKLNIDTSALENIRTEKLAELKQVENPLEIKLNTEQAEAKVKSLKEQLDKLDKGDSKAPVLKAQLEAAEKMKEIMKAAEQGVGSSAYEKLDDDAKEFIKTQAQIKSEIDSLRAKQIKLDPELNKSEWDGIEQKIAALTQKDSNYKIKIGAQVDANQLAAERARLEAELAKVKAPVVRANMSQGYGETDGQFAKRQAEQKEKEREITQQIYDIIIKQKEAQGAVTQATEEQVSAADKARKAEADRVAALEKSLKATEDKLELDKQQIGLADKLMENDKKRLDSVRELADAYMDLAEAQDDLVQSEFDVSIAVNEGQESKIKDEMDAIKEAGKEGIDAIKEEIEDLDKVIKKRRDLNIDTSDLEAQKESLQNNIDQREKDTESTLKPKEEQIKALKEESKRIEEQALAAAIEGAQKRFEMERKILELKQMADEIEARAAVRASQRAALEARIEENKLQQKLNDPKTSAEDKAQIGKQLEMQRQVVALTDDQVAADKEALATKKDQFAIQKEALAAQQAVKENEFAAQAAKKFPDSEILPDKLKNLQDSIPNMDKSKMSWDDIAKKANNVLGVINNHNKALDGGEKSVAKLADAWKKLPDGKGQQGGMSKEDQQQREKERLQKAMQDPNFNNTEEGKRIEAEYQQYAGKARKIPLTLDGKQLVADANGVFLTVEREYRDMQGRLLGITTNTWRAISEEEAQAIESASEAQQREFNKLAEQDVSPKSAQGAADDLGVFEAAAKQAGVSVEDLGKQLEDVGFVELNAGALDVNQQSIESLQKMREELFGPEAQKRLFTPEGMKGLPDFSLKPTVDTTQAEQDLQGFKQGEASKPLEVPITTTAPEGSGVTQGGQDQAPVIRPQVDTTEADQSMAAFRDQQGQSPFLVDFDATGLDQIQGDLYNANEAVNAFKANGEGAGYDLANGFTDAANSIVPFSAGVNQLGLDLQALDSGEGVDPFQGAGQSLSEAAYGAQALVQGLETAKQSAAEFDSTLADSTNADQIQQAYDALQPPDVSQAVTEQGTLAQGTEGTIETTQDLANSWVDVATGINIAAQALATYKSQESGGNARFAGGPVLGGHGYTVNELGQESFLSRSGMLSLIRAPQYGKWIAPSRGLVIPASMTSKLDAAGAFDRGGRGPSRVTAAFAGPSPGQGNQVAALGRLQRSIDRLEKTLGSYRPPDVHVSVPGNAGLLHTLQSIR
jgi:TP901 family phage tail tape measure protein